MNAYLTNIETWRFEVQDALRDIPPEVFDREQRFHSLVEDYQHSIREVYAALCTRAGLPVLQNGEPLPPRLTVEWQMEEWAAMEMDLAEAFENSLTGNTFEQSCTRQLLGYIRRFWRAPAYPEDFRFYGREDMDLGMEG